jgi:hypothetical protein
LARTRVAASAVALRVARSLRQSWGRTWGVSGNSPGVFGGCCYGVRWLPHEWRRCGVEVSTAHRAIGATSAPRRLDGTANLQWLVRIASGGIVTGIGELPDTPQVSPSSRMRVSRQPRWLTRRTALSREFFRVERSQRANVTSGARGEAPSDCAMQRCGLINPQPNTPPPTLP